jgi:hypothetical protein
MWLLCRNLTPGEVRTCKLSRQMIIYGDYYYQDSENPKIYVKATELHKFEKAERERSFDYSKLHEAQNQYEYREMLIRAQEEYLAHTILGDKIVKNGTIQEMSINGLPSNEE